MTFRKTTALCCFAALLGTNARAEPPPALPGGSSSATKTPVKKPPPLPVRCQVDPAVTRITLERGKSEGSVRVTVEVRNLGRSAWQSGTNQQVLSLTVRNGNTGVISRHSWPLPARAAAGATMGRHTTPMIANAFDTFEFTGTVEASISYDPDILIDGNACNDDRNQSNNTRTVNDRQVGAFLGAKRETMSF